MSVELLPPLVLTGPPAVGKSVTGAALARRRQRAAFIDVDDVRQLVVAGGEAPWRGAEGAAQSLFGVRNACALAGGFRADGFDVVIVDVLTPATAVELRERLPGCLLVHLTVTLAEARRRAETRKIWLTDDEFDALHRKDLADPPPVDVTLDVTGMDLQAQRDRVEAAWAAGP